MEDGSFTFSVSSGPGQSQLFWMFFSRTYWDPATLRVGSFPSSLIYPLLGGHYSSASTLRTSIKAFWETKRQNNTKPLLYKTNRRWCYELQRHAGEIPNSLHLRHPYTESTSAVLYTTDMNIGFQVRFLDNIIHETSRHLRTSILVNPSKVSLLMKNWSVGPMIDLSQPNIISPNNLTVVV